MLASELPRDSDRGLTVPESRSTRSEVRHRGTLAHLCVRHVCVPGNPHLMVRPMHLATHHSHYRGFLGVLVAMMLVVIGCTDRPEKVPPKRASIPPESATPRSANQPASPGDTLQLRGVLFDVACHAKQPENPDACEGRYVRRGYPVGVRTTDMDAGAWILVTVPQALADYLTTSVRVKGVVRSEGILIPHSMSVASKAGWTTIM